MPKHEPPTERNADMWRAAYTRLYEDSEKKVHMKKLQKKLKKRLNQPDLDLRTDEGHKVLLAFISKQGSKIEAKKRQERFSTVARNMLLIKDMFGAGAAVGGPYVAIPAAALFMVFSMDEIYTSEKYAMLELAERAPHYYVLTAKGHKRTEIEPGDDENMRQLRHNLRGVYIDLYTAIMFASAQLANFLCDDSRARQWFKNTMKRYNWKEQLEELNNHYKICESYCGEMVRRRILEPAPTAEPEVPTGPGPRNALHWAVAYKLYTRIGQIVSTNQCPINAVTTKGWTAAHLAAEHGDTEILKLLRSVSGINIMIKNADGRTPLHIAALNNRVGAVKLLLGWDRRLIRVRDNKNRTAFLLAAAKGHVQVLEALKAKGQNMNESTIKNGWTALHLAAEMGHVDAVKFLLTNGVNKDTRTTGGASKGSTAKQIADHKGRLEVAEVLR